MSRQPRGAARTRKRAEKKRGGGPTRKGRARAAAEPQEELLAPAQPTEDSEHEADGADAEEATSDGRDVVSDDAAPAGAPAEGGAADVIEAGSAVVEGVEGEEGGDASDTDERGEGAEEDEGGDASDADEQDDSESKSRAPAGAARRDAAAEDEDDDELVDGIPRDLLDAPDEDEPAIPGADSETRPGLEKARPGSVSEAHLKSILESLIFVSDKPVPAKRLARVARARTKDVERLLGELVEEYRGRGIELVEIAGGYQFRSAAANAPFVREIVQAKPVRLTRAQLETLAITAYRQPLTRPEIEEIRGVDSGSALKVLLERGLVKILGRKDEAGRPLLYGTTPQFLELFGLSSLDELPTLREFSELTEESRALFARKTGEEIGSIGDIVVPEGEIAAEGATDDEEEHEGEAEGDGGRGERAEAGEDDDEVDADAADGAEAHEHERETDEGVEAEESGSDDGAQASAERDDQDDEDESDEDEEDEDESDEDEEDEEDEDEEDEEDDEEDDDEE